MQAMIFAAGLGTRLKPLTDSIPKALVEVGGEPLLKRVIMRLKDSGCNSIVVNVHHFSDKVIKYIQDNNFGINISISDESAQLLDTGGGLKKAEPLFNENENILIHNVDIISNTNLRNLYDSSIQCDAMLLVSERVTKRYLLFDDEMNLLGWTNIETGEFKSPYPNIKEMNYKKYAFAGIHAVSPRIFSLMKDWPDKFSVIDFYIDSCAKASIKGYLKKDLRLMDVGKMDSLRQAEEFLNMLHPNSL